MGKKRIAIIGCGFIGNTIASAIEKGKINCKLEIAYDDVIERARKLGKSAKNIDEVLGSEAEIVVECASQEAVKQYSEKILKAGKDLMIMSVGALGDKNLSKRLKVIALKNNRKIYLPSGAIGALDSIKSASIAKIESVILTTRKPPKGLKGAPYLVKNKINIENLKKEKILYEGNAREAVKFFPKNVNVCAALSLAGIGFEKTIVRIIADPNIKRNIHEISARGEFGELYFRVENVPSRKNPKTSYLAALSAISCLKKITEPIQ